MPGRPFPPDDRSVGYERGTSISKAWDQATTDAALEAADFVAAHLKDLAGVADGAGDQDREKRLREFCSQFAERAFRRPLAGRAAGDVHRPAVPGRPRPGDGGQAGGAAGPQVAAVPLSRARHRRAGPVRRGVAALVRAVGLDPRPAAPGRRRFRPAGPPRAGRRAGPPHGHGPPRPVQAPRVPPPVAAGRPGRRDRQGPQGLPRLRRGGRLRPAQLARAVPRRRHHEQVRRLPRAARRQVPLSQRPAGAVLRRGPAAGRAVPQGSTGRRAIGPAS